MRAPSPVAALEAGHVRAYACAVAGCPPDCAVSVARFEGGNRHQVYRVSHGDPAGASRDTVVRVATGSDPEEQAQAALEAAVLERLDGVGAPRLYDFRTESAWFETPAMCMEFIDGQSRVLLSAAPADVERLGAVVASVHNLPPHDLHAWLPGPATIADYVDTSLELHASYLPKLREPMPAGVRARVDRAFTWVAATAGAARRAEGAGDRLVLLHGDVGPGNILWAPEPVLIDWEYARLGDPADEIAYIFGQHGLGPRQRAAFWVGYQLTSDHPRIEQLIDRTAWWEPVALLGSAMWWLERWSRRADADAAGAQDASTPKPERFYLDEALRRLDRFDAVVGKPT
jgi:aminoglycoside phosphotransferase (APT) family kinase protein